MRQLTSQKKWKNLQVHKNATFVRNALKIQINMFGITITLLGTTVVRHTIHVIYLINPLKVKIPCIIHNLRSYDAHLILSTVKP